MLEGKLLVAKRTGRRLRVRSKEIPSPSAFFIYRLLRISMQLYVKKLLHVSTALCAFSSLTETHPRQLLALLSLSVLFAPFLLHRDVIDYVCVTQAESLEPRCFALVVLGQFYDAVSTP
jgi:hypothetical protein